ncbi:ABC transporter permease [Derxia gummosa]|uniref:ABC transporter permease n=1 Tax=Derxia gummosa DSM 723 TaxID=1121388 RepID=A0A8B6X7G4_9BURK|nr:FtsX-like permease family protein [Derxia gummosa]
MRDWLPFEWIAATRFLREGRAQSLFIVAGVAIGVAVIVFMSALLAGLQLNLVRRTLSAQSHITLLPPEEVARPLRGAADDGLASPLPGAAAGTDGASATASASAASPERELALVQRPLQRVRSIDQWRKLRDQLGALPGIAVVTPVAAGSAFAQRGDASRAIQLAGVEPDGYFRVVALPDKLVAGSTRLDAQHILVGTELASDLGVRVGDKLRISAANGNAMTLTVGGTLDLGSKAANARNAYVLLPNAQSLLRLVGGASSLEINVTELFAADRIAADIAARTGLRADSWIGTNAQFFSALKAQTISNTVIRAFVALSVAFGIASVLVVSVVQRSKEIGILRAMGASRGQVLRVFLLQGGLLGLGGSLVGSSIGFGALALWHRFARNTDGTPIFQLDLDPMLFVSAALLATLVGVLAATTPALRAARLDPVQAIRG